MIRAETVSCLSNAATTLPHVLDRPSYNAVAEQRWLNLRFSALLRFAWLTVVVGLMLFPWGQAHADNVFLYSSTSQIRGVNLDLGTDDLLTSTPFTNSTNALATNSEEGLVYYGSGTEVFVWDIALGNGAAAHSRMNNFATGAVQAPITNLDSGSGSYANGVYYVGSEEGGTGDAEDIYAVTMSSDGRTVLSAQALGLLTACGCTGDELGGFGDIAAVLEAGSTVLYGISANGSDSTKTGRWRFDLGSNTFTQLANGSNGQLSNSASGQLYTNVNNGIRTLNKTTGALGSTDLFTLTAVIYDFTSGFSLDFGDAPASYGAAMHRVPAQGSATTFLGALPPDNEAGTLDSSTGAINGLGDDLAGQDDEDAVASLNSLNTSDTAYAFAVSCTAGAFVSAWADFNRNGIFDADERSNNAPQVCNGSSTTLAWTGLSSNVAGSSYIRIRVADTAQQVANPTGLSNSGEIEDHALTIVSSSAGSCPAGQIAKLYPSSDIPKTIPVGATSTVSSTLTINDDINVLDLNVINVVGTHDWLDDLELSLIRGATTVPLFGRQCGNNDDFDFGFDDESSSTLVCPPVNGDNLAPSGALSTFDNQTAAGDWTLNIQDVYPTADGGVLQSWALEICTVAGPAQAPDIRLGKVVSVAGNNVTVTLRALNSGNTALSSISLTDNLDNAFGAGTYTLVQAPQIINAPSGFNINANFTGGGLQTSLLGAGGTLAPAEELRVRFTVRIDAPIEGLSEANYTNQAYTSGISPSSGFSEDLSAPSLDLTFDLDQPTPIAIRTELLVSGRVFVDSSLSTTSSHDGIDQPDESGIGGRLISAFNASTAELVGTAISDGNGDWTMQLDGSLSGTPLQIQVQSTATTPFISEAEAYSVGSVTDGLVQVTPMAGTQQTGVNIGVVQLPSLLLDHNQTAQPDSNVRHAHRYTASSPGQLSLTLNSDFSSALTPWPSRLLLDQNCNGAIDETDTIIAGAIAVTTDQLICLIVDVFVAASQPMGANHIASLTATLVLDDVANTGHAVVLETLNTNRITVVAPTDGRLLLSKSVRNVTLAGTEVTANTALPGHVLEYTIRYVNEGAGAVTDLVINDNAPAYTQVLGASVTCDTTPGGMSCTPGVASSAVRWDFSGDLPAGAQGSVSYRVTIE